MNTMEDSKSVLIIDDDADWVEANRIALEANSYKVFTAYSGQQGIFKFLKVLPDLVILDISMERRDEGFYVGHKIRSYPNVGNVPIIMITAIHQSSKFRFSPDTDGNYLPADELIDKPADPSRLLELVHKWLKDR
ncbi:MAG: response regulator [bacterium]